MANRDAEQSSASPGSLNGRVALVTGGGGGIGSAYARGLAGAGASVVVADIRLDAAQATADALTADGYQSLAVECDVTSEPSWTAAVDRAAGELGGIDILVNNAALMAEISTNDMLEITIEEWDLVHRVNLTGPLLGVRAVVPHMREQGWGKIINQSSAGAYLGGGPYRSSKLALHSLTVGFARQLAPFGIRVNAIAPGQVNSEAGWRAAGSRREKMLEQIPFGLIEPEELVPALVYLASPASDKMTGQILNVDGGWIMHVA
jgi:NAD(P)-dependent dehydrogenase (short-subunit alcohol dehydrogenase family)